MDSFILPYLILYKSMIITLLYKNKLVNIRLVTVYLKTKPYPLLFRTEL